MALQIRKVLAAILAFGLSSCASFSANKVNISDYPQISRFKVSKLSLVAEAKLSKNPKNSSFISDQNFFAVKIADEVNYSLNANSRTKLRRKCSATVETNIDLVFCPMTNLISPLTLTVFPYYCQYSFESKATLKTSSGKILKEYQLNDRAHEVWWAGLLLMPWLWDAPAAPQGNDIPKENIAKALTRQIIHDASKFQECRKVPSE